MFISFEGIDGSGKSTQARLLVERLEAAGCRPLLLREPGGTEVSERIRSLLLDPGLHIDPFAELLLFSAARTQLVVEQIRPALAEGRVVVCDRFYDSTTAYQGGGRQLGDLAWLQDFNRRVTGGLAPDRTYWIELDPGLAHVRRAGRVDANGIADAEDRMERAGQAFQEHVAKAYAVLAASEPSRIRRIDGRLSIEAQHRQIWENVSQALAHRSGTAFSA